MDFRLLVALALTASIVNSIAGQQIVPPAPGVPIETAPLAPSPFPIVPGPGGLLPPTTPGIMYADAPSSLRHLGPGRYTVFFIHPATHCPVSATFAIRGRLVGVKATMHFGVHRLVFKVHGFAKDVVIKFKRDGSVVVVS